MRPMKVDAHLLLCTTAIKAEAGQFIVVIDGNVVGVAPAQHTALAEKSAALPSKPWAASEIDQPKVVEKKASSKGGRPRNDGQERQGSLFESNELARKRMLDMLYHSHSRQLAAVEVAKMLKIPSVNYDWRLRYGMAWLSEHGYIERTGSMINRVYTLTPKGVQYAEQLLTTPDAVDA